ncbi:MAG: hypothetical protein OJF50_001345 [Nitrospira sp.]|nr:hypothetical protein [Nitrospira sp.]
MCAEPASKKCFIMKHSEEDDLPQHLGVPHQDNSYSMW